MPVEHEISVDNSFPTNEVGKEYTGYVTFWFDDGYNSTYNVAFPELEKRGWDAVIAVLADREYAVKAFYPKEIIAWNELEILEKAGWEISSHSTHHLHLNTYGEKDDKIFKEEITDSSAILKKIGFEVVSFTFPYGEQGGTAGQKYVKDNYDYWRSSQNGVNELPAWKHLLAYSITPDTTKNVIRKWITEAENSGWLIINFHDISEISYDDWDQSIEQFIELLKIIEESNLQVVIPKQIYGQ